jgi:hypothetical protein
METIRKKTRKEKIMTTKGKTWKPLTKNFIVNGKLVFLAGTRLYEHGKHWDMYNEYPGFEKDGGYVFPHYYGYGKALRIPAEYFAK